MDFLRNFGGNLLSNLIRGIGRRPVRPNRHNWWEPRPTYSVNNGHVEPEEETDPDNPRPPVTTDDVSIRLEGIDYHMRENTTAHYTDRYEITQRYGQQRLVVRRGKPFLIKLTFNKPFDIKSDDVRLVFTFGKSPMESKGTRKDMKLSEADLPKDWGAKIDDKEGNTLTISVHTPPNCMVGIWEFSIDIITKYGNSALRYVNRTPVYILFNPWCEDDQVYLDDEKLLEEYVLNETGRIYQGTAKRITPKPWNYAQFQGNVLDCAILLLDGSSLLPTSRGDPIKVSRIISKMVNANDENGVVYGRWDGEYDDGTSPTEWNGSERIMEQYYSTKQYVSYGQCWVFAGVTNTVCRALGLPARCISNFNSAHDTDGSITIDNHFDKKGEPLEDVDTDSVWNYHAWNEVWMARPDLPHGYGGWQVIDATPQETSEGVFQCGPTSLEAIKQGEVTIPYDGKFVFAEVNADRAYWVKKDDGTYRKVQVDKTSIGSYISTKSPFRKSGYSAVSSDSEWWEDVTSNYKYEENSPEERAAVVKAQSYGIRREGYDDTEELPDARVSFKLVGVGDVKFGSDFHVTLQIANESGQNQDIGGTLTATAMYYTGVPFKRIKVERTERQTVRAGERIEKTLKVTFNDYYNKLAEGCHIRLSCQFRVFDTKVVYTTLDHFNLLKPDLTIQAEPNVKLGDKTQVHFTFVNPLNLTLTECKLHVEGPGLIKPTELPMENVGPSGQFQTTREITPSKIGQRELIASFTSRQLLDVCGSLEFNVTE